MDILDRMAEPLALIGAILMLAIIAGTVARCIRAFIQGINEADDPRHAADPPTFPALQQAMHHPRLWERSLKTTLRWISAYLVSVVILFIATTSGGWPRMSYVPELLFSLVIPLLVLRLFAYFLRLGDSFMHKARRR